MKNKQVCSTKVNNILHYLANLLKLNKVHKLLGTYKEQHWIFVSQFLPWQVQVGSSIKQYAKYKAELRKFISILRQTQKNTMIMGKECIGVIIFMK